MGNNTHTLTIRVPEVLKNRIERVSALQGVSINKKQLLRAVDEILAAVPERPVPEWDRLPKTRS